jgi:hypothetical protein
LNITRVEESKRIRWTGHVESMGKRRNACISLVEITEIKEQTWKT